MSKANDILERATGAAAVFRELDQAQTDRIVREIYHRALDSRVTLARQAHEETGIGVWEHKVIKNVIATQLVYDDIRYRKTVGVISSNKRRGITVMAHPIGPIFAFTPVNNPTSTTIFKALIAMKTRNPLIISPHQAARRSTIAAAEICAEAAEAAGAPGGAIQWLVKPSPDTLDEIMRSRRLALILATGTDRLVAKARLSGTPIIGVGPGNVPVYIGRTADVPYAVTSILESKLFDNGSICASEQAVVVKRADEERIVAEFEKQQAYFLSPEEIEKVGAVAYDQERGIMSPMIVGQSAGRIAAKAGIDIPQGTKLLVAKLQRVGREEPLSAEILAPILAFYVEEDFDESIRRCIEITWFGGSGHTAVIYSNHSERIEYFSRVLRAGRILVNMPATQGALGGIYNTLNPSFTLSCGSEGRNLTTDNITISHLLNINRIARRRPNPRWFSFNHDRYLDESIPGEELEEGFNRNF
ncbi:aldehyde dehydrogenase family protein [Candidatus Zixiibacteriota bacterium]